MKASHQPLDFESPRVRKGSQLCLPAEEGHHQAELSDLQARFCLSPSREPGLLHSREEKSSPNPKAPYLT